MERSVVPAPRRLRQEDGEFQASLGLGCGDLFYIDGYWLSCQFVNSDSLSFIAELHLSDSGQRRG